MGSVEVLGVGSACAAGAAVFALHAPFAKLAPAPIAWAPSSCRRPRPRASAVVWSGIVADSHSHARHVRWCALTPARGRGSLDTTDRMSTRAAAETSARGGSSSAGDSDYDARDETKNAAVVERVAVLVLAATGIPIGETSAALAARPGLVRALVSKDETERRNSGAASSVNDLVNDVNDVDTVEDTVERRDDRSMSDSRSLIDETFRAERRAASALRFLTREVGFSAETLARTLRARNGHGFFLIAADVDETSRRTFAFLRQPRAAGGAGLSLSTAARAASRDPRLLLADAEDVRARFAWLTDVAGVRPADAFATHADDSSLVMLVSPVPPTRERAASAAEAETAADPEPPDAFADVDRLGAAYEFLRVECCLGAFATRAMLRKYPNALTKDVENTMRPALVALRAHVSGDAAAKVIAKYPSVLTLLPETLEKKFFFLRETCALDGERINKLVSAAPSIVTLSVTNNLQPTFAFLAYELGLGEDGARAVLAKAPSVFGLRRENVGPKFAFFAERAGRDAAVAIFTKAPSLLGTSLERNIAPTAGWIVETCVSVGFGRAPSGGELPSSTTRGARPNDDDENSRTKKTHPRPWDPRAVDVLVSCPSLLGMSVERKLAPTLAFLLAHFPDAPAPILFRAGTFSLRGHVAPRVFLLAESGAIRRWAPGTFLAWNVGTFCEKAGVSREAYDAKVRSCKSEELDTLGGGFSLKKKTAAVRSETSRGRDGAVSEPRDGGDETETETGTDASASIRSAIRARAEGGGAAGRDRGSTPAERARARRAAKRRADAEKEE